jgi:hypothetical protein
MDAGRPPEGPSAGPIAPGDLAGSEPGGVMGSNQMVGGDTSMTVRHHPILLLKTFLMLLSLDY